MATSPHNSVLRGHCTWFPGEDNYPQLGGTRPNMRTFTQKQNQPQKPVSSNLARSHTVTPGLHHRADPVLPSQRTVGNQAVQPMLQTHAEELKPVLTSTVSPHFGHDFSRIPIHPPAAGASSPQVMRMAESEPQPGQTQHGRPGASERAEVPSSIHEVLRSPGQTLDGGARDFME